MKLNTKAFRYLSPEDWRVLTAVEIGSKNHEVVPTPLIVQLASLRTGSNAVHKSISTLAKADLVARVKNASYDGYRLTYGGLDYLALHAHTKSDAIVHLGSQMGVGKESDIYLVTTPTSPSSSSKTSTSPVQIAGGRAQVQQSILKIHRLGRTSFRSLNNNRSYKGRRAHCTWQYLSRLSAQKEYTAMCALYDAGFPVPKPIAWNRHTVVMQLVPGIPLRQVALSAFGSVADDSTDDQSKATKNRLEEIERLYSSILELALELAGVGVIHGDFNEFNILVENVPDPDSDSNSTSKAELKPWLIDFPQITSLMHPNAEFYFQRDIDCIKDFFRKRYNFIATPGANDGEEDGGRKDSNADEGDSGPTFQEAKFRLSSLSSPSPSKPNNVSNDEQNIPTKRKQRRIDVEIEAAGFSRKMAKELSSYYEDEAEEVTEAQGEDQEPDLEAEYAEDGEAVDKAEGEEQPQQKQEEEEEEGGDAEESGMEKNTSSLTPEPLPDYKYSNVNRATTKTKKQMQTNSKAAAGWAL